MKHDIAFFEDEHKYLVDGTIDAPSVTTVLNYISDAEYKRIDPSLLLYAARRGTLVHEYCEAIDYDIPPETVEAEIVGYIKAYLEFLRDYRCSWEQIESAVYSEEYGFAGTIDRAGLIDGKESVLDIKTLSAPTKLNKFSVCMQTAAYAVARRETYGVETQKRFALYLKKDGDYTLMDCGLYEVKYGVDSFAVFSNCLQLYNQVQELKEAKPIGRKGRDVKV